MNSQNSNKTSEILNENQKVDVNMETNKTMAKNSDLDIDKLVLKNLLMSMLSIKPRMITEQYRMKLCEMINDLSEFLEC